VTTLKSAGDSAGTPKRPSAFSMPIATAANETSGRNGIITRVSRTVSSAFPGASSKPGAIVATSGQASAMASQDEQAEHDGQEAQDAVGEPEAGLLSAFLSRARVGREERGRERPLGEQVSEQVRDSKADPEGVGVVARPQEAAKTCSRTRPRSRETRVIEETRPAAFARRTVSSFALTSKPCLAKLKFCSTCEEDSSGTSRVSPEAGTAEHQAPGTQQAEPFTAQDPGEEAPRRHRRGQRQDRAVAARRTVGQIDKAAKKGVIHDNAAARYKSRLTRKVRSLAAAK
jgi:hypothetical protein